MTKRGQPTLECDTCGKRIPVASPFDEIPPGWIAYESSEDDVFLGHACSEACFAQLAGNDGVTVLQRG